MHLAKRIRCLRVHTHDSWDAKYLHFGMGAGTLRTRRASRRLQPPASCQARVCLACRPPAAARPAQVQVQGGEAISQEAHVHGGEADLQQAVHAAIPAPAVQGGEADSQAA